MVLLSILKFAFVCVNTAVMSSLIAAVAIFFNERAAYRLCVVWARSNLVVCGVRVHARRLAALDPSLPYVFMSNHRSQADIPAVIAALDEFQLRWVAKKELTRIPIFGWALQRAGHIIVDRSDHRQAVESLRAARERMQTGISVVIFPEGTRSLPGQRLLPFKKGGFMLAHETGIPIVPVVVLGSGDVLPPHSWHPRGGDVEVIVGPPIPVAGLDRDELVRRVETFMLEQLEAGHVPATARHAAAEAM